MNKVMKILAIVLLALFFVFATVAAFAESPAVCTGFALACVFCGFTGGVCLTATKLGGEMK